MKRTRNVRERDESIPVGLCQCGCGGHTPIATQTDSKWQAVKGEPRRFMYGHYYRSSGLPQGMLRQNHGYIMRRAPHHPRANWQTGYVMEHILVAEAALGKYLPAGAEVHHANGIKSDNRPGNLVVCPDRAYHFLLHQRQRALDRCGHADWRPCEVCGKHDNPAQMSPHRTSFYHRECYAAKARIRKGRAA